MDLSLKLQMNKNSKTNIYTETHTILSSIFKTRLIIDELIKGNITFTHARISLIA